MSAESSASSIFPRTDWAELGRAGEADEARLDRLIRTYWAPLRIFLVATFPSLKDQADLLLQDFAEDKILKKGWLQRADRSRGKFRDFLKTSLRNFVLDRLNRAECKHAAAVAGGTGAGAGRGGRAVGGVRLDVGAHRAGGDLAADGGRLQGPGGRPAPARVTSGKCSASGCWSRCSRTTAPPPYEQLIGRFGLRSPTDASNLL